MRFPSFANSFLLVAAACAADPARRAGAPPRIDSAAAAEIARVRESLRVALVAGDPLAAARAYSDDAVILGPGGDRHAGRAAIDAYWSALKDVRSWTLEVDSLEGAGDLFHERGRSTLVHGAPGRERTSAVEYALVWRKDAAGAWRIAVDAYWDPPAAGR